MAIEATFVASEGEFPLAEVFSKSPSSQIELDRVVPTNEVIIPYFWLRNLDSEDVEMSGIDHPGIIALDLIDDVDGELLVRINWDFEYKTILTAILETDVELVSAVGQEDRWTFELRGEDQQGVSDFKRPATSGIFLLNSLNSMHSRPCTPGKHMISPRHSERR